MLRHLPPDGSRRRRRRRAHDQSRCRRTRQDGHLPPRACWAHPDVEIAGVVDTSGYVLVVSREVHRVSRRTASWTPCSTEAPLDAVVVATPDAAARPDRPRGAAAGSTSSARSRSASTSADSNALAELSVSPADSSARSATTTASSPRSRRSSACSTLGALGRVTHVLAEAYGPVVLKPQGSTWRSQTAEGGGALYDYAAHPLNLLTWYLGATRTGGQRRRARSSRETDDEVFSTLGFADGHGPAVGELERRVPAQDVAPDHGVGHPRPHLRRPPGDPGLPA